MDIGRKLSAAQLLVPVGYYSFVLNDWFSWQCQWMILFIGGCIFMFIYYYLDEKYSLNKITGFELYLLFTVVSLISAGSLSFDEMRALGVSFSSPTSYGEYFIMKITFNLFGLGLLPISLNFLMNKKRWKKLNQRNKKSS
ncbi:hypothetical protein ACT2CV_01255 [Pasteurellaceae bacterium 22721_9_1]